MSVQNDYPKLKELCSLLDKVNETADLAYMELMSDQHLIARTIAVLQHVTSEQENVEQARKTLLAALELRLKVGDILGDYELPPAH
ncbi:hypothetical protein [Vibrio cionasavignyae]|uniref:hypothetical protein n=1 Tax=Vibrio cionasavignyae TaxID=2910252 RepID=UPI003D0D4A02